MLRRLVRGFGDRHAIPSAGAVRQPLRDELLRDPAPRVALGDAQEEEVHRLAGAHGPAASVLRIQLPEDVEDGIELRAQAIDPVRQRRGTVLVEQHAAHLSRGGGSGDDGEPVGLRLRTEQANERLELRRGQAGRHGRRIVSSEHLAQERHHLVGVGRRVELVLHGLLG